MSTFTNHDHLYNKVPLSIGDNRDEHILIDVLGNWIPECDLIYYGLMNSHYSEKLYKLKNTKIFNPHDTYLDNFYFTGDDLIRFLASPDDTLEELSDDLLTDATATAFENYFYVPCNETMIRHSIIELSYFNFVKSITLLYPWGVRDIDYKYLKSIIPYSVSSKFIITSGNMLDFIKSSNDKYTTIILNSMETLNTMIDNCNDYRTSSTFFLLRNHSGNVSTKITETDGKKNIEFIEEGNTEILSKLIDVDKMIPKTQMRFARYEPYLFEDTKPNPNDFILGQ